MGCIYPLKTWTMDVAMILHKCFFSENALLSFKIQSALKRFQRMYIVIYIYTYVCGGVYV